ncbi:MAG: peptidylprolyl isomerase [Longimicrobiales bacterium]|nr:peptidylprolyl isomerase [Longimicrobiales bacterium]
MNRRHRSNRVGALLLGLGLLAGCTALDGGPGEDVAYRPPDGLLADPDLQGVVDAQVRRDGAALVGLLSSPTGPVRARAALALGSVQDTAAVAALTAALEDREASVRRDAAFALGQAGVASAIAPLADAFPSEEDAAVRQEILRALGNLARIEAVTGLLRLELRPDEEAARVAALAHVGAVRGVATQEGQARLLAVLDDPDAAMRRNAAYYFGRLADASAWAPQVSRVRDALNGYGRADPAAMYLIQALGRLGDRADGARIRSWVSGARDWRIRTAAAAALGALPPDPENREALLTALDDGSPQVAAAAAQALARGNPVPSELQRMRAWIEAHPDAWQVAAPLLVVLARADEREFVFAWLDGLPEGDPFRWDVGLQALGFMPGEEAVERLQRAAASADPRIQGGAVGALLQRWSEDRFSGGAADRYFPVFSGVLRGRSPQAAFSAAQALSDPQFARLGNLAALMEAYRGMKAPEQLEPMIAIVESLGRIGSPEAADLLSEAARAPQPALRAAAARALESMGLAVPDPAPAERAPDATAPGDDEAQRVDWAYLASLGTAPRLRLETERGDVVLRLHTEEAPLTVQTLARLAQQGKYDGVPFHRVVPNFVVQGGDFSSGDGFGGPGFAIPSEFTLVPFGRGVAGMASSGKDTEGSQFFITHSPQPHLDGAYTAFGWVVEGMDVVDRLMVGDRIVRASVEPAR